MDNYGIAFGNRFKIIHEVDTTIVNCQLSIVN